MEPSGKAAERPADSPLLVAGRQFGERYRLTRPLGRGGMAAVWLATDERLGRQVAVKVISDTIADDAEFLERFRREATLAAGLQHANLVSIYDFATTERPYLVMEYVDGGDLAGRLASGEVPPVASLAAELLSALRHIHSAGVLHRDVKPQNVLIDGDGHARLTDFGIAQMADATGLTRTGRVIGTENYLAPEVLAGAPASERSDLYALGVVLTAVAEREGSGLTDLFDQLRDESPQRRPESAASALAALERRRASIGEPTIPHEITAQSPTPVTQVAAPTPAPTLSTHRGARRSRVFAAAALGAAILVAGAVAIAGGGGGDDPSTPQEQTAGNNGGDGSNAETPAPTPAEEAPVEETPEAAPPVADPAPAENEDGRALNEEGKALLDGGDPDGAIPILEQAVAALEGSGDELTYNFALYNLGDALVQAGRPDEAIPILEQRLAYPDQTETVQAKLDEAYAAAGLSAEESSGTGPDGTGPPGLSDKKEKKDD